ncbi:MAG: ABC transporter transmembrane domain-containing protein, partial [Myxococcota bacterium]
MTRYGRLLRYAIPYRGGWARIVLLTLLSSAVVLLQPWPLKIVVDHILGQEPMADVLGRGLGLLPGASSAAGLLAWMAGATLGVAALSSAVEVALTHRWIRVGQGMVYDLAADLFAQLQRRSLTFHSRNPIGDSISRITGDSWCVHTAVDDLLLTPCHALITLVAMVAVMAQLDPGLTVLSLLVAPFLAAASLLFGGRILSVAKLRRETESRIHSQVQRTLSGIAVVQAFTQEDRERERFEDFASAAVRAHRRSTLVNSFFGLNTGIATTLGTVVILGFGSLRVLDGDLSVGSLLVFLAYVGSLQAQMQAFTGSYAALQDSRASIDRVMEVLEAEGEVVDRPGAVALPPVRGHVRFEKVSFGYDAGRPVL